MLMTKRKPATIGEILVEEFMKPIGLTQGALADAMEGESDRSGSTSHPVHLNRPLAKRLGYIAETIERGLQAFDDFGRDFVGWR